jgi:putative redox protein
MNNIEIVLKKSSGTASAVTIRNHELIVDRPDSGGGSNAGPMGGELFLASIGGCFMSTLVAAAAARDISVDGAICTVVGEIAEGPRRFSRVTLTIDDADCSAVELGKLLIIAERGCLVVNTLKGQLEVSVGEPAGISG